MINQNSILKYNCIKKSNHKAGLNFYWDGSFTLYFGQMCTCDIYVFHFMNDMKVQKQRMIRNYLNIASKTFNDHRYQNQIVIQKV